MPWMPSFPTIKQRDLFRGFSLLFFFPLFSPSCPKFIGQTGTVHRITDRGDVRVQFNSETRWTFHPGALTKVGAGPGLGMLQGNH